MMVDPEIKRSDIILSANRALWGEVSNRMRTVLVKSDAEYIRLRFVIDGPILEDDRESAACAGTEVVSDFPYHKIEEECIRIDAPEKISTEGWYTVFKRKEVFSSSDR